MSGMTVIVPQSISVSASSEYGSFAADRLLTQNLGQVWQGDTYQETLNITAPAGANALAIFGTNALSIEVLSIIGYVGRTWGGVSSGGDWANDRSWAPGGKSNYLALTNEVLHSYDFTAGSWWVDGTDALSTTTGLDGDHAGTIVTDDDTAIAEWIGQDISTSPVTTVARFFVKKIAAAVVDSILGFYWFGDANESESVQFNSQTGAISSNEDDAGTLQYQALTSTYNDDFWEVCLSATPSNLANTGITCRINPTTWTDAETGTITIGNAELYFNAAVEDIAGTDPIFTDNLPVTVDLIDTYTYLGPDINNYWLEWDGSAALSTISLQLTGPQSGRVYAGVAAAGVRSSFPNPKNGLSETVREFAIHYDNPLGSSYHRKINAAREFNWSLLVDRDRQFYEMMKDIIYKFGSAPMAWRVTNISGDSTDPDRMIWGSSFMKMPRGVHAYPNNSTIEGYLREFL